MIDDDLVRTSRTVRLLGLATLAACSSSNPYQRSVQLDKFASELRLETELRDESFTTGATTTSTRELAFRENLRFDFDASVYHPKLLTVGGTLDLGLEQRQIDQEAVPQSNVDDDNTRYDLRAVLLRDHPYSAHLIAQRSQVRVRQSFFPTDDAVFTRHAALVLAKEWVIPTQIEIAQSEFDGETDDLRDERRDSLQVTGARNDEALQVNYQFIDQRIDGERVGGDYDDLQATAGATLRLGDDLEHSVSVDGLHRQQTGDVRNENSTVNSRLRLALTDELDSRTGVSVGTSEFDDRSDTRTDRTDVFSELEHRLYDSLTTTVRGDLLEQTVGTGDIRRVGASGRASYRKQVPFGELRLDYRLGHARQEDSALFGANVTVTDEPHVVVPGNPILLANPNVDQAAILVTDATGTIVYSEPLDYTVERVQSTTRLLIPVGSSIVAGQTILVSYVYALGFDRVFESDSQHAGIELLFGEVLSLDGHWTWLDEDLLSGTGDETLDHAVELGAGARLRLGRHDFTAEYLDHDSRITPYERSRLAWDTWLAVTERLHLAASASVYETLFDAENERERGTAVLASVIWQPVDTLSAELRTEARRSELRTDSGTGLFFSGLLRYRFRKTALDFELTDSEEEWDFASDRSVLRARFMMTRKF